MEDLAICRTRELARMILRNHKRQTMEPYISDGVPYKRRKSEVWRIQKREVIG